MLRALRLLLVAGPIGLLLLLFGVASAAGPLSSSEQLGKSIFFDQDLSLNKNQSCATCHAPAWGFTGPSSTINAHGSVYEGSIPSAFGDRKPPTSAYADLSPVLYVDRKGTWIGGNFWDGRATGWKLGNPAADQAQGPFLNPAEQALPDAACVVYRVSIAAYPVTYEDVWGAELDSVAWPADIEAACADPDGTVTLTSADRSKVDAAYDAIALSIAAYEGSTESNAFSSKYDLTRGGGAKLTALEQRGLALFRGKGGCAACHPSNGKGALFTDFTYDNLGIPSNSENPAVVRDPGFVDYGLGAFLERQGYPESVYASEMGKQKVPTLRNVDLRPSAAAVKAYGHNGYFKTLEGIVHFYNTRDVLPTCTEAYTEAQALAANCWPEPEVADNVNEDELGDLGLTADEEAAIVAFLRTLSDGYAR
jgi:cytochrome c peroxidase